MSRGGGTTLYVTGFGHGTRARDLAYEFERYVKPGRVEPSSPRTFLPSSRAMLDTASIEAGFCNSIGGMSSISISLLHPITPAERRDPLR